MNVCFIIHFIKCQPQKHTRDIYEKLVTNIMLSVFPNAIPVKSNKKCMEYVTREDTRRSFSMPDTKTKIYNHRLTHIFMHQSM